MVGDVVGRGITAAATMGQLRSATRALAATGLRPGPLLDALDQYARRHGVGMMATVAYAELDLRSGQLCLRLRRSSAAAVAGRRRRALLSVGGAVLAARRAGPRGTPAGGVATGASRSALVLYSDGLVERRTRAIEAGMEQLAAEVARRAETGAQALADTLLREFRDADQPDDVCVLVARRQASA